MKQRSRFLLIILGVIIFLIVAPAIILFARGYYFDFENFRIISTGILSIKTDPKGANVHIDGNLKNTTPSPVRFLKAGEYEIVLSKDGYLPWKKRITIHDHLVTSLPESSGDKIFLLAETTIQSALSTTTLDFSEINGTFYFLEKNNIYSLDLERSTTEFVTSTKETLISDKITNVKTSESYYILGNNLVYQNPRGATTTLFTNLPNHNNNQIIIAPERLPYLILDQTLYETSDGLKKLNDKIEYAFWQVEAKALIYGNSHEIWMYEPGSQADSLLITRSTKTLGIPVYNPLTRYLFVSEENEIKAIEVDTLGQPNVYVLSETQNQNVKPAVNSDATQIFYLDGQNLYSLKIR